MTDTISSFLVFRNMVSPTPTAYSLFRHSTVIRNFLNRLSHSTFHHSSNLPISRLAYIAFANLIIRYHDFSQYNIRKIVGGEKMTDILGIIKTQREVRGWSEYQLAERSGLPQSTISSWYKKDMTPSFASLEKICDAFGITLSQFFADGEESVVLTPSQRKMLDKWNCLTEAQHNSLLILMDSM